MVYETLTGQLAVVMSFGLGALLIAIFPVINRESRLFGVFSLVMGILVWLLLLWFTFGNDVVRYQILKYGLH